MPLWLHTCLLYAIYWLILADNPQINGFLSARVNNLRYCFNLVMPAVISFPEGAGVPSRR